MAEEGSTNPFERLFGPKLGRAVERFTLAPVTRLKLLLQTQVIVRKICKIIDLIFQVYWSLLN